MELTSKKKIRRKPSGVQRTTCNAVEALENEQGHLVTATDILSRANLCVPLKTLENRLQEYTRKGWLRATVDTRRGKPTVYGITDAWIDLLDAVDNDTIQVTARDTDTVGCCEGDECNAVERLIYYKGKRLCKACLNPEYRIEHGDDTHPLVNSNLESNPCESGGDGCLVTANFWQFGGV